MKRACQVQRASRKPQHATKPMTTLCESGAALARPACKPQPQLEPATEGILPLRGLAASRNRNPQPATEAILPLRLVSKGTKI